ncbi:hypothetical protein CARUB_v10022245mg [Capsella rubella]|uniref:Uncharacterized protein n=1 Tax=Capsella rubella TaxID=81985 RepID=R0I998_9BRAS|nr:hypothetical protein CARUB_v10022245mg [Capsella rubella]
MEGSSKGLTKGAWTAEEDALLKQCIDKYGEGKWHQVPLRAGKLSTDEVDLLIRLHKLLGNRWSLIAGRLPGRTANDVKNYWNTHLSKKTESCCKTKMRKKNIISHPTTTMVQKINVFKPRPRSFTANNPFCSHLNGQPEVDVIPSSNGLNNNDVCENSITFDKDDDDFINNLIIEDNMWLENLLDEIQEPDAIVPEATTSEQGNTMAFDVENLWSLFNGETVELD